MFSRRFNQTDIFSPKNNLRESEEESFCGQLADDLKDKGRSFGVSDFSWGFCDLDG